jgi:hypothetical protein
VPSRLMETAIWVSVVLRSKLALRMAGSTFRLAS